MEKNTDRLLVKASNLGGELRFVFDSANAFDLRADWISTGFFGQSLVHARSVESSDFLIERRALLIAGGGLSNFVEYIEIAVLQLIEAAPDSILRRDGIRLHPITAGICVKVTAWIDAFIDRFQIDTAGTVRRKGGL